MVSRPARAVACAMPRPIWPAPTTPTLRISMGPSSYDISSWAVVLALVGIGGRQLGFAILMHEAAHRSLFRSRRWNDVVGNWVCAYPVWSDLYPYRAYHLQHHAKTGTAEDPDLSLAAPFPVTRASLRRKIWRDLTGQTGWKRARATFRRDLGRSQGRVRRLDFPGVRNFRGVTL